MEPAAYSEMATLEGRHWWFVGRRRIIDALLSRLELPKDAKVLEIGCGTGGNLEMLSRYGELRAAEYNDGARALAAEKGVAVEVAPCELPHDFPFEGEQFDLIVLFDVLEHIEDDLACLNAVRVRMKLGGWLVLTVPAYQFLWSAHDEASHHYRRYTRGSLEKVAREASFGPAYAGYFNTWLFPAAALVRFAKNIAFNGREEASTDLSMPAAPVNGFLTWLFASERHAMGRVSLPFGLSCILSARPVATEH